MQAETAVMTSIGDFVARNNIAIAQAHVVDENPFMDEDPKWDADHWLLRLKMGQRRMTVFFSQGAGHRDKFGKPKRPELNGVIDCLATDARSTDAYGDFESWANDIGHDMDSRRAERCYQNCLDQARRLKRFLGPALYNELLHKTEPL